MGIIIIIQNMKFATLAALACAQAAAAMNGATFTDAEILASHSQLVSVPIDEKRALALKSFRKIVGYDTFESIRKKNRSEAKDTSDYYNVTVSMMIQRKPVEAAAAPAADPYAPNGATTLAATLDKGFPYDD